MNCLDDSLALLLLLLFWFLTPRCVCVRFCGNVDLLRKQQLLEWMLNERTDTKMSHLRLTQLHILDKSLFSLEYNDFRLWSSFNLKVWFWNVFEHRHLTKRKTVTCAHFYRWVCHPARRNFNSLIFSWFFAVSSSLSMWFAFSFVFRLSFIFSPRYLFCSSS